MVSNPEHGPDVEEQPSPLKASTPQNAQCGQGAHEVQKWAITDRNKNKVSKYHVPTRFFIISDTHNDTSVEQATVGQAADVLILCGNITQDSIPSQYKRTAEMLSRVEAPLKLAIAGNHDYSLEELPPGDESEEEDIGLGDQGLGDAKEILEGYGFKVLDEGHYTFSLPNGAELNVYASPGTPYRTNAKNRRHAFQYIRKRFRIFKQTDVVITHGPPVSSLPRHLHDIGYLHLLLLSAVLLLNGSFLCCRKFSGGHWQIVALQIPLTCAESLSSTALLADTKCCRPASWTLAQSTTRVVGLSSARS